MMVTFSDECVLYKLVESNVDTIRELMTVRVDPVSHCAGDGEGFDGFEFWQAVWRCVALFDLGDELLRRREAGQGGKEGVAEVGVGGARQKPVDELVEGRALDSVRVARIGFIFAS